MSEEDSIILHIGIDPEVITAVVEVIILAAESLEEELAVRPAPVEEEEDLREILDAELHARLHDDCEVLIDFLQAKTFDGSEIRLATSEAEKILRAASAVRLRLQQGVLSNLEDEALESGEVNMGRLPLDQQRTYACYLFLAGLQSFLIETLDPISAEEDD